MRTVRSIRSFSGKLSTQHGTIHLFNRAIVVRWNPSMMMPWGVIRIGCIQPVRSIESLRSYISRVSTTLGLYSLAFSLYGSRHSIFSSGAGSFIFPRIFRLAPLLDDDAMVEIPPHNRFPNAQQRDSSYAAPQK